VLKSAALAFNVFNTLTRLQKRHFVTFRGLLKT